MVEYDRTMMPVKPWASQLEFLHTVLKRVVKVDSLLSQ